MFVDMPIMTLFSGTLTVTSTGAPGVALPPPYNGIEFVMSLTAAATDAVDTLDAYVQALIGSVWIDIAHFTQAVGNGGTKRFVCRISPDVDQPFFNNATALAAGQVRNIFGDQYRVRADITDANANASFSFSVTGKVF